MRRLAIASAVLVCAGAAAGAVTRPGRAAAPGCVRTAGGLDLQRATIADLQRAMAAGRVTSAQLVRAYESRIAAFDIAGPKLNSVRALNPARRAEAASRDAERRGGRVR